MMRTIRLVLKPALQHKKSSSELCPRKVILPVNDGRLVAINADTGERCTDFGKNGEVDLAKRYAIPLSRRLYPNLAPCGHRNDHYYCGFNRQITIQLKNLSGVIRGYDVNTGALLWVFDTGAEDPNAIPAPGQKYVQNSPNAWAPLAYDAALDIVYIPTGVGTPDIWGGNRTRIA